MSLSIRLSLLLLAACTPADKPADPNGGADTDVVGPGDSDDTDVADIDTDGGGDTDGEDTDVDTDDTGPTSTPMVTCNPQDLLPIPLDYTSHNWAPIHEDYTFSADGYLYGTSAGSLRKTPFGGPSEVQVPNVGDARGTRFLLDGTLVLADIAQQALVNVDPTSGAQRLIRGNLTNPNGVAIGADGMIYVTVSGQILRVDPASGDAEVVVDMPGRSFDGITFSPDYKRLYFNEEFGNIHSVDFDDQGNPGQPVQGPNIPIPVFSILDGMAVDACGNLYVVEMAGRLWRVSPTGDVEVAVRIEEPATFLPAVNFGLGAGGYDSLSVYIMDFTGQVHEAVVGVPGKWEPHLPVP